MSRSTKKNPDKSCPRGRKRCRACQLMIDRGGVTKKKDERRDCGRSEER